MKLQWIKDILGDAYTDELDAKVSAALGERFVSRADFSVKNTRVTELETQVGQLEEQAKTDKAAYEKELPRTQEGIVQFMAENVPSFDEMAEAITMEVFARLVKTEAENPGSVVQQEDPDKAAQEAHDAPGTSGGTSTPGEAEEANTEAPVADGKPKRGSKPKTQK